MRRLVKSCLYGLATLLMLPVLPAYYAGAWVLGRDRALEGVGQAMSLLPGLTGQYLRRGFYHWVLTEFPWSVTMEFGTTVSKTEVRIGEHVYIGANCQLGRVRIGALTLLGSGVRVLSGAHPHSFADPTLPILSQHGEFVEVRIGRDCWIGAGAIIMADVGDHAIVGAGSVVTHPVPECGVAYGVPARVIRMREVAPGAMARYRALGYRVEEDVDVSTTEEIRSS